MAEQGQKDILLHDPLSDVTRRERRTLLGVSMFGVALVKTGLIPTKISALGVEFDQSNQDALLRIVAFITLYFLIAFIIYSAADFLAWRRSLYNYLVERAKDRHQRSKGRFELEEERAYILKSVPFSQLIFSLAGPVSIVRALFEFLLPVVVGAYAFGLLVK